MADNAPAPEGTPEPPSLPPAIPAKPGVAGKAVSLSSVAKAPPPIPGAQATPEGEIARPGGNVEVKQPPRIISARPPGTPVPELKEDSTPDLVRVRSNAPPLRKFGSKKTTARLLIPKIKLNQPVPEPVVEEEAPRESILLGPGDTIQERPTRPQNVVEKPVIAPQAKLEEKPVVVAPPKLEEKPVVPALPKLEEKPVIPAPPKLEEKPTIPTPPKLEEKSVIAMPPKLEQKPAVIAPRKLEEKPVVIAPPKLDVKPVIAPPKLEAKPPALPATPLVAPPMVILPPVAPIASVPTTLQPPVVLSEPVQAVAPTVPPPLSAFKALDKPAPTGVHVVPKMVTSETAAPEEKLRPPPQLPHELTEVKSIAVPPPLVLPETTGLHRAPAMIPTEPAKGATLPPPLPAKSAPTAPPESKISGPITQPERPAAPIVTSKVAPPPLESLAKATKQLLSKQEENKPALRPAVLPSKSLKMSEAATAAPVVPAIVAPAEPVEKTAPAPVAPPVIVTKPEAGKLHAPVELPKTPGKPPVLPTEKAPLPLTRAARAKKRRIVEMVIFYVLMLAVGAGLYIGTIRFTQETRVEGQVIPPAGMPVADEVWIVSDFRQLTSGIAEDLSEERAPLLQEMRERQDHVQRVQADIAMREDRIRLLQAQIQSAKDDEVNIVKEARDQAQDLWDGPGAQLDDDYNARRISLQNAISSRAKSLNLKYAPDPTYNAPEVWANAYRLALYEVPTGVDSAKEYTWLNDQMKQWRDFVKAQDDKREQLREQAAEIKIAPAAKLTDLNSKIEELQHRIESTQAEEDPLKPELQQAQGDLAEAQTAESGLDTKYYKQLSGLPGASITKRLPVEVNGRFTWASLENDSPFAEGENEHHYWIFSRATRADGREYWALGQFSITKNHTVGLLIEPDSFVSTKALLRPELSPDEQAQ